MARAIIGLLAAVLLTHGCSQATQPKPTRLKIGIPGVSPQILAVYEPWFGHPQHIAVGYSSHDPAEIKTQIRHAKTMGISAFVIDWYGDREPFIDRSYAMMQEIAQKQKFRVAMMYDETDEDDGATDEAIADFTMFRQT